MSESRISNCQEIIERLRQAILNSDADEAALYAANLAKRGLELFIAVQPAKPKEETLNDCDKIFPLNIIVENMNGESVKLRKDVTLSMTFENLKYIMLCEFGVFPELQRWIYETELPADKDTLRKHHVNESSIVYVYLISQTSLDNVEDLREKYKRYLPYEIVENTSPCESETEGSKGEDTEESDIEVHAEEAEGNVSAIQDEQDNSAGKKTATWQCQKCTYNNFPSRPGCKICTNPRPESYEIPDDYEITNEEKEWINQQKIALEEEREVCAALAAVSDVDRYETFQTYQAAYDSSLISSKNDFICPICFNDIPANEGVCLRECLHEFCIECLKEVIKNSETPEIKCPFQDAVVTCNNDILHIEIKELLTDEEFNKLNEKSLQMAEARAGDKAFHCKTVNCPGWCEYDDDVNFYTCGICSKSNCLTCKAIHEGQNCKSYQEDLSIKAKNDSDAFKTHQQLMRLIETGEAMKCPNCSIILSKKFGCDWLKCSMCRTEICWITKGPRWGPAGTGDTSGGCKCGLNNKLCHPNCGNCH